MKMNKNDPVSLEILFQKLNEPLNLTPNDKYYIDFISLDNLDDYSLLLLIETDGAFKSYIRLVEDSRECFEEHGEFYIQINNIKYFFYQPESYSILNPELPVFLYSE